LVEIKNAMNFYFKRFSVLHQFGYPKLRSKDGIETYVYVITVYFKQQHSWINVVKRKVWRKQYDLMTFTQLRKQKFEFIQLSWG